MPLVLTATCDRASVRARSRTGVVEVGGLEDMSLRIAPGDLGFVLGAEGQVDALTDAGPALLASSADCHTALQRWFELFVDFLVTKHGLAAVLQSDDPCFDPLHSYFIERIVPVCAQLLLAAASAGEIRADQDPHELMRGVASLCAGASTDTLHCYDARRLVSILIAGLSRPT
jgi:transcriptional regulator SbtR-like protein